MSEWINNKRRIWKHKEIVKPCHKLGFCPYGQLVEEYPIKRRNKYSCKTYGHECPVYYQAEGFTE